MKSEINLGCRDCKKYFPTLQKLNQHISKTGHNDGNLLQKFKVAIALGIKNYSVSIPS
jgi:hypothetical protein